MFMLVFAFLVAGSGPVKRPTDVSAYAARAKNLTTDSSQASESAIHSEVKSALPSKAQPAAQAQPAAVDLRMGGFVELSTVFRKHFMAEDVGTSFWSIPFPRDPAYHTPELRISARQSRLFLRAEAQLGGYWRGSSYLEVDFLGAAHTANSVQSNSYTPRLRHGYALLDVRSAVGHVSILAGQTWSLITMGGKQQRLGLEYVPPGLEAQYAPGFLWARQPQLRFTVHHQATSLTAALSIENPQTTYISAVPAGTLASVPGGLAFDPCSLLSIGHIPDVIFKVSHDLERPFGAMHTEMFAVGRAFSSRRSTKSNSTALGGSIGAGLQIFIERLRSLQLQISSIYGTGMGRYGSGQLGDATFSRSGGPRPVRFMAVFAGAEVDPSSRLKLFVSTGAEILFKPSYLDPADNSGCQRELGSCSGVNRYISHVSAGAWVLISQQKFVEVRMGLQYLYAERTLFSEDQRTVSARQHQALAGLRLDFL